ncbi:hypothetical protein ABLE93_25930 [Xanthobacter sp. KR7-65]|uniref:hypothetical protein n=1 Tax=Xanthobacter sp. KR7-65 TaxID=3156612 RepID=UPI0032B40CE3
MPDSFGMGSTLSYAPNMDSQNTVIFVALVQCNVSISAVLSTYGTDSLRIDPNAYHGELESSEKGVRTAIVACDEAPQLKGLKKRSMWFLWR